MAVGTARADTTVTRAIPASPGNHGQNRPLPRRGYSALATLILTFVTGAGVARS